MDLSLNCFDQRSFFSTCGHHYHHQREYQAGEEDGRENFFISNDDHHHQQLGEVGESNQASNQFDLISQQQLHEANVALVCSQKVSLSNDLHNQIDCTSEGNLLGKKIHAHKSGSSMVARRYRHNFTQQQISAMEKMFDQLTHYPDWSLLSDLSKKLNLPASKIQIWFQNRRAKFRRKVKDDEKKRKCL